MAEGRSRECGSPAAGMEAAAAAERFLEEGPVEVEEQLVMVELSGIIDSDFLEKCEDRFKILGIETERPILQVDRYVFAGEYEVGVGPLIVRRAGRSLYFSLLPESLLLPPDTLGTCVVFEENKDRVDAEGNQKLELKYKCHTMKKLNMTRTLLNEKKEGEESTGGGVEWLELKDKDFSHSRPKTICSFLYEKEEEAAESQDRLAEESEGEASDKTNFDQNLESEMQPSPEMVDDSSQLLDNRNPGTANSPSGTTHNITFDDSPC